MTFFGGKIQNLKPGKNLLDLSMTDSIHVDGLIEVKSQYEGGTTLVCPNMHLTPDILQILTLILYVQRFVMYNTYQLALVRRRLS